MQKHNKYIKTITTSVKKLDLGISMIKSDNKHIFFKRERINEPIPFILESLGNQNLLQLLPAFFHTIENEGMLMIDEFSSGFHNQLE